MDAAWSRPSWHVGVDISIHTTGMGDILWWFLFNFLKKSMVALGYMIGGFGEDTIRKINLCGYLVRLVGHVYNWWIVASTLHLFGFVQKCGVSQYCNSLGKLMKFGIAGAQFSGKSAYCGIIVTLLVVYIGRSKHPLNRGWSSFSGSVWINDPRLDVHCFFRSS